MLVYTRSWRWTRDTALRGVSPALTLILTLTLRLTLLRTTACGHWADLMSAIVGTLRRLRVALTDTSSYTDKQTASPACTCDSILYPFTRTHAHVSARNGLYQIVQTRIKTETVRLSQRQNWKYSRWIARSRLHFSTDVCLVVFNTYLVFVYFSAWHYRL